MVIIKEIVEPDRKYEVFLNFRGEDTRNNFTDHLYKALVDANIYTFLDHEEIPTGEDLKPELESAIKESRASIVVLSKNYASSTWCLDELVMILEQRRTSNHIVLPIFYHVEPTDVRKQQRSFEKAFVKHKQNIEAETDLDKKSQRANKMKLWKKALTEVADLKGMDANGRMEYSIKIITSWFEDISEHAANIFTICGPAGIGKTSLAKYVYQSHYRRFESSIFLEDIERKSQQSSGLIDIQKQLLQKVSNTTSIRACDAAAYTYNIEKVLFRKRVLLVLDGIDSLKQLDALLGRKGFHPGSKIIITTKEQSLVEKCSLFTMKVQLTHIEHLLETLDKLNSIRLLSWHAFCQNVPEVGYEEVSRDVAEYCGGHPLALEVIGSSLRNKNVAEWDDTLKELGKEIHPDIQKVLQISVDSLPFEKDKMLFKHIACFFVGKDRELSELILKACDVCSYSGIKNLINRCFLTIGPENKLMIHQLLQDVGRNLVCQEAPKKPWKRSLLWTNEECFDVLKEKKGTSTIQSLVFDMKLFTSPESTSGRKRKFEDDINDNFIAYPLASSSFHDKKGSFETNTFSKMCNLKLLQLNHVQLNGCYNNFPKGLRWLCLHGSSLSYIPSDLQMDNMVGLDMSYSNLQQLWKNPKLLASLKYLNLTCCEELVQVGHFTELPMLERLILAGCVSLIEVCESIGKCNNLALLDVSGCNKLKKLPKSIGKLKKVRILSINGCENLDEFPVEINDMESLETLNANHIRPQASSLPIVDTTPRSLKSLVISLPNSLVSLTLTNNNLTNESFPMAFSTLSMLKRLKLDENPIDCLPIWMKSLSKLRYLSLRNCHMLKSALHTPSTIINLNTSGCHSLGKITFHPEMSGEIFVNHTGSTSLGEIAGLFKMQALAEIDVDILYSLGWFNLEYVKDHKLQMQHSKVLTKEALPVQMFYQFGIFNTFFYGKDVPDWLTYRSKSSSMSFTMPTSPRSCKIRGLNVCFLYTFNSHAENISFPIIIVENVTKNFGWLYNARTFAVKEANEDGLVWLSHWMFGNNDFKDGDKVRVQLFGDNLTARKWGISPVYYNENNVNEEDPLAYYKSWRYRIGGDLSPFKLSTRGCFLRPTMDAAFLYNTVRPHVVPEKDLQPMGQERGRDWFSFMDMFERFKVFVSER